jgi:hypothetical protein
MYIPMPYGGQWFSRWVGQNPVAPYRDTFASYWPPGNPRGPGDDVWPHLTPDPVPWAVAFLVSAAVRSKAAAANMTNQTAAQQIGVAADQAIAAFIDSDNICPPWPYPGPPPWLSIIASQLTLVANNLQAGALQTGILQVAGQVLDRAVLSPQPPPPRSQ